MPPEYFVYFKVCKTKDRDKSCAGARWNISEHLPKEKGGGANRYSPRVDSHFAISGGLL